MYLMSWILYLKKKEWFLIRGDESDDFKMPRISIRGGVDWTGACGTIAGLLFFNKRNINNQH